jgi:hypothetical protein
MVPRTNAARLNAAGLLVAAAGMVLQKANGSTLYPSYAGPVVLVLTAVVVTVWSPRWAALVALVVPLVLAVGLAVTSMANGDFPQQLADPDEAGVLVGSVMHVVGLLVAVAGGVALLGARASTPTSHAAVP